MAVVPKTCCYSNLGIRLRENSLETRSPSPVSSDVMPTIPPYLSQTPLGTCNLPGTVDIGTDNAGLLLPFPCSFLPKQSWIWGPACACLNKCVRWVLRSAGCLVLGPEGIRLAYCRTHQGYYKIKATKQYFCQPLTYEYGLALIIRLERYFRSHLSNAFFPDAILLNTLLKMDVCKNAHSAQWPRHALQSGLAR